MERSLCIVGPAYKYHRRVWQETHGPIPSGLVVMHDCDNPRCYNVQHLRLGTHKDNTQDMLAKGRHHVKHGVDHYKSRLDPNQVADIRAAYRPHSRSSGTRALARKYRVHHMTVSRVVRGVSWKEKS